MSKCFSLPLCVLSLALAPVVNGMDNCKSPAKADTECRYVQQSVNDLPPSHDANAFSGPARYAAPRPAPRYQSGDIVEVAFEYGKDKPGTIVLVSGQVDLKIKPLKWGPNGAMFQIPCLAQPPAPIYATAFVKRPDGTTVRRFTLVFDNHFGPRLIQRASIFGVK